MRWLKSTGLADRPVWVRFAQVLALWVWLVGATPVLPWAAAVLGGIDGQHEVRLFRMETGMAVVLHHGSGLQAPDHQHSVVSDLLVMVGTVRGGDPDHVLVFSQGDARRSVGVPEGFADRLESAVLVPAERFLSVQEVVLLGVRLERRDVGEGMGDGGGRILGGTGGMEQGGVGSVGLRI